MSVFLLHPNHISAIVAAAVRWSRPGAIYWTNGQNLTVTANHARAQEIGAMLYAANLASVETAWREPGSAPASEPDTWATIGGKGYVYTEPSSEPDPVYLLRMLNSYEYQTDEMPDYTASEAFRFIAALRDRAIQLLPGMLSAPHSITDIDAWSTAADRRVKWVPNPQVIVQLNHGTSKSIVTGPVTLTFTQPNMIVVDTDAPVNTDAPGIMFRDNEYRTHLIMIRTHTGEWVDADSRATIERRQMFGADASPTARKAILAAVHAAVVATWTPDLDRQAQHAQAAQKLPGIADKYAAALATLRELDGQLADTRNTYNRTRPIDE